MREIIMEITLLYNKMNEVNGDVEMDLGNGDIPFAKVLYTITKGMTKDELFKMDNETLIKHIRKIQLIES